MAEEFGDYGIETIPSKKAAPIVKQEPKPVIVQELKQAEPK